MEGENGVYSTYLPGSSVSVPSDIQSICSTSLNLLCTIPG